MSQAILTNPQELETWLDEFMAEEMSKLHLPGVTFWYSVPSELLGVLLKELHMFAGNIGSPLCSYGLRSL